ncbi:MAG: carboxypeptidase-like regulatory domain-containing protein [Acidobacteriaceae bacterium]
MTNITRWSRACAIAVLMTTAMAWMVSPGPVRAQQYDKMVQGKVSDNSGRFLANAIVYLQDTRNLDVKSYITQKDGVYRFGQLSQNDDYKLWAELNEKKSAVKTISSFDPKKVFIVNLHIDTSK